ncbi:MAG: HEAT repeat domain-containing protein [Parachlamydiales bacterium]|nr:HEAT repeat domain-containing protein [Parachlamydiales bacterium]
MRPFIFSVAMSASLLASSQPIVYPIHPDSILDDTRSDDHIDECESGRILLAMQHNKVVESIRSYERYQERRGEDDYDLVHKMASLLLRRGFSDDPEAQLLTLFGAGITRDTQYLDLFAQGLSSSNPQLQMASSHFLANFNDDVADEMLKKAMASPYLMIRFETAYSMAKKRLPHAANQIEALMYKVDPALKPFFPKLLALEGSHQSLSLLRQLINDTNKDVRIETLLSLAETGRDDLLSDVRIAATQLDIAEQESAAYALGCFKDEESVSILQKIAAKRHNNSKLAALFALTQLGREDALQSILDMALKEHDIFAITLLGFIPDHEDDLFSLVESTKDSQIRANAAIALLNQRDARCINDILNLLIKDQRDLALQEVLSAGRSLKAWKVIGSAKERFKDNPLAYEKALAFREQLLAKCLDLPQDTFLEIAETLLTYQVRDLIPTLVDMLTNIRSEKAIDLLKRHLDRAGSPLIRAYCNLGLYRLKEKGSYGDRLVEWVLAQKEIELIRFRPIMPWKEKINATSGYVLTPLEQSRLLVDSLTALANQKDPEAIHAILETIARGNPKNRPALAGLLIRALE